MVRGLPWIECMISVAITAFGMRKLPRSMEVLIPDSGDQPEIYKDELHDKDGRISTLAAPKIWVTLKFR